MCTCFPQRSLLDTEFPTYRKKRDSNPSRDYYSSNTTSHNYPRSRSRSRSRSHTHSHHTRDASRFTARTHSHSRSVMHYPSSSPSHFLADRPPSPLVQSRSMSSSASRSRSRSISTSRSNSRSRSASPLQLLTDESCCLLPSKPRSRQGARSPDTRILAVPPRGAGHAGVAKSSQLFVGTAWVREA